MIEIVLNQRSHIKFIAEAKKRMKVKGWSMNDLAEKLGKPVASIYDFFSSKKKPSRFLAAEIADVLEMKPKDWKG